MQLTFAPPFMARLFGAAPARPRVSRRFAARVTGGATQEIEAPPGTVTVHCRSGEAWITHDGDPRDRTRILVLSSTAFTLMFAVWLMFGVLGIAMREEFGLTDIELGWLAAVAIRNGERAAVRTDNVLYARTHLYGHFTLYST